MIQEPDGGSDLAWREHCYRRCGTMPEAVRRNPVAEFRLGSVSYQLGDRFRCERATTTRADPERIVLLGSRERRPHLGYVLLEERYHLTGQRHLVWAARFHLWALEYQPPFFANLAKVLADLDLRKCPECLNLNRYSCILF
jgi:hypothetical protein